MPRQCAICEAQASSFVREKFKEYPTAPAAVIKAVYVRFGLKITYSQLKNHRSMHDPLSGTLTQARRTVTKRQEKLEELVNTGTKIINNLEELLVKGTDTENLNWEQFKTMPLDKQVKLQIDLQKLALAVKNLEIKQAAMKSEKNAMLGMMNQMAAQTFKSKPKVTIIENAEEK